jgi:hypothetical protein
MDGWMVDLWMMADTDRQIRLIDGWIDISLMIDGWMCGCPTSFHALTKRHEKTPTTSS